MSLFDRHNRTPATELTYDAFKDHIYGGSPTESIPPTHEDHPLVVHLIGNFLMDETFFRPETPEDRNNTLGE